MKWLQIFAIVYLGGICVFIVLAEINRRKRKREQERERAIKRHEKWMSERNLL